MAKGKKKTTKSAGGAPKKRGGKLGFYSAAIVILMASPFIFPTIILIVIGMMPTIIELFIDNENDKSSTSAVAAMNFAGVTPFIIDLWTKGQKMPEVFHLLGDSTTWLFMLGGAAIGKMIVFAIPQAMASLTFTRYESRLKLLKQNTEHLKTTWGPDVATVKPLDRIVRPE